MKWEESLQLEWQEQGTREEGIKREMEWAEVSKEIANMNRPYARG